MCGDWVRAPVVTFTGIELTAEAVVGVAAAAAAAVSFAADRVS